MPPKIDQDLEYAAFGEALWDPLHRRLLVRGEPRKLAWRVAECLRMLVEAEGEVVSREDLETTIWSGALVEESNLAHCVGTLRKALDPAPSGASYIETVARVGYRLAVPVQPMGQASTTRPPVEPQVKPRISWVGIATGVAFLLLTGFGGVRLYGHFSHLRKAQSLSEEGITLLRRGNLGDGLRAAPMFQQALELVPNFALAHAGLAEGSARFGGFTFGTASELARKAVKEDPNCGECQAIAGFVLMTRDWNWKPAGEHLARSIAMDENKPLRHLWYAMWLAIQGRLPEAARQAQVAMDADAALPQAHSTLGMIYIFEGKYREAALECDRAIALNPDHNPGHAWLSRTQMMLGNDVNTVLARAEEVGSWANFSQQRRAELADHYQTILRAGGRSAIADFWIGEVNEGTPREVHRYNRALWFMWKGDQEAALAELEAAVKARPYNVVFTAVDPAFAPLRTNPRFREVVHSLGLRP
ncbi:MAG: winged helix-turn-helix domain-containing protein [Acidobacteriota bacterium]